MSRPLPLSGSSPSYLSAIPYSAEPMRFATWLVHSSFLIGKTLYTFSSASERKVLLSPSHYSGAPEVMALEGTVEQNQGCFYQHLPNFTSTFFLQLCSALCWLQYSSPGSGATTWHPRQKLERTTELSTRPV